MTDWTPGTAREMCIDADIQAHRPSKTSAVLMTRTRLCLLGDLFGEDFNGGICSSSFFKSTVAFGTIPPVSATEAAEAVTRLKSGKVKWPDGISAELWKRRVGTQHRTLVSSRIKFLGRAEHHQADKKRRRDEFG